MVRYDMIECGGGACRVTVQVASFTVSGGVCERHAMLHVEGAGRPFAEQAGALAQALGELRGRFADAVILMCRLYLSDAAAQQKAAAELFAGVPLSVIQQPPMDGSKAALWAIFCDGMERVGEAAFRHNGYTHRYDLMCEAAGADSAEQTAALLERYEASLSDCGMALADDCVRTWFFVRDVDVNYKGVVDARRENFIGCGLTERTHYIASTGIEGKPDRRDVFVRMDAYAVEGLSSGQQRYLYAKEYLNPTYEYGVTFERGVRIDYGDRSHSLISGTASIDNRGRVVHVGDVRRQTEHMWENVAALLHEGGASMADVMSIVVYIRDTADYGVVRDMFARRWPDIPTVITLAPVCRPEWLVEMECMAVTERADGRYRPF